MYVLNKRNDKLKLGIFSHRGNEDDFILPGDTFEEFLTFYYNDFWHTEITLRIT